MSTWSCDPWASGGPRRRHRRPDGEAEDAVRLLHHGLQVWRNASAPYDAARARLLLASAMSLAGDTRSAMREVRPARSCVDSLGARLGAARAATLEAELETSLSTG